MLGPQHPPIPGVHNLGWVQGPGEPALKDASQYPRLKENVMGVLSAFANDKRSSGLGCVERTAKPEVIALLPK